MTPARLRGQRRHPHRSRGDACLTRSDGEWSTNAGPKAKINIIPLSDQGFAVGLSGNTLWNLNTGQNTGSNINVPFTIQASKDFRININAGWLYDAVAHVGYGTYGAGFEWNFVQPLTLIGEVFGLAGRQQDVRSVTEPRAQVGLRWTPAKAIDLELIYGRNIYGENANLVHSRREPSLLALAGLHTERMSALGQKPTCAAHKLMSAGTSIYSFFLTCLFFLFGPPFPRRNWFFINTYPRTPLRDLFRFFIKLSPSKQR